MPGRQPEDWGIPLWEAIERWTPRELWERYRELAEYDIPLIIPVAEDPRSEEVRRLRSRITEFLVNRLARGELIASGIALPLNETSQRLDIRLELWPLLGFNTGFEMVTGDRIRYDQILIREASAARHGVLADRPQAAPPRARARRPGRPSIMPMIAAEMRRRAARGLIEGSLSREAEVLAIWAQEEFADRHVPKPESIERKLGAVYKELGRTKRPNK